MRVLVLNSGSSSIKYRLYDMRQEELLVAGKIERIGESQSEFVFRHYQSAADIEEHTDDCPVSDHAAGLNKVLTLLSDSGVLVSPNSLSAIAHRVVHGGQIFDAPTLINEVVIDGIRKMIPLAPLHNPANLIGIEITRQWYPDVAQVAVFDTAFFRTLPPHAHRYALPDSLYQQHHVRRYGFHGISHQYVVSQAAEYLQQPLETLRLITLHLGNGASAAAIHDGICIDTSMGMTPLEGLMMGTRCGDLDPSLHFYLARTLGMDLSQIETLLNHDSGMKGLCGVSDMREVHHLANKGDTQAQLAIVMYCYRIAKYIGAYYTVLGSLDALVFTGGIGEHDPLIRQSVCDRLSVLGIILNQDLNHKNKDTTRDITADESKIKVLVIPTNEELEIARQTVSVIT